MITVKSAKKTLTGNFEINGYCLMEDEKPTENIANGSKLWELNSGDKYVFDEENTEWIKLTTAHAQGSSNIKTKTYTGTLDTLFDIDHIKEYYEIVNNNGAIGIMTSENMSGVNMALNYSMIDTTMVIIAGANMEGLGYGFLEEDITMMDFPYQAETSDELVGMVNRSFQFERGFNIVIIINNFENNPEFMQSFCYLNSTGNTPNIISLPSTAAQNLGSFTLTFYYMNNIQPTITTETISSSSLKTIFSANNYTEEQFNNLVQDICDGKAFASIPITIGNTSGVLPISAVIMNNRYYLQLNTSTVDSSPLALQCLYAWDLFAEDYLGVVSQITALAPNSTWQAINDDAINNMTGQSSYDLIITRTSDAQ